MHAVFNLYFVIRFSTTDFMAMNGSIYNSMVDGMKPFSLLYLIPPKRDFLFTRTEQVMFLAA